MRRTILYLYMYILAYTPFNNIDSLNPMYGWYIKPIMTQEIPSGFVKGERFAGIRNTRGQKAGLEQNWGYYATDPEGNQCVLLYCNPGLFTVIDHDIVDQIRIVNGKQVSWYGMKTGYVGCHTEIEEKSTCLTLHQVIMNYYGHGKEGLSIDHINRNKLDNRRNNLRIATQPEQNTNRGKIGRHRNAKELPTELDEEKLPIYVVYYKEKVGKNGENYREFFTVEGHPLQRQKERGEDNIQTHKLKARRWATTKSNEVSINQKLEYAKQYVEELNHLMANPDHILVPPTVKKGIKENKPKQATEKEKQEEESKEPKQEEKGLEEEKEQKQKQKTTSIVQLPLPKQWKIKTIYHALKAGHDQDYKIYCEENNDMSLLPTWQTDWDRFVHSLLGLTEKEATPLITAFVENLRRLRHNKLCYDKNAAIVDKEDRQQWPATTVVRAFLDGKMEKFKAFTESSTDEDPANPLWIKRWTSFLTSLENARENPDQMKTLCSKFMTAQRTKKYRKQKATISISESV